jgi:hypothetical protein
LTKKYRSRSNTWESEIYLRYNIHSKLKLDLYPALHNTSLNKTIFQEKENIMSTAIATLPRAGGNGAALVVIAADFVMALFAATTVKTSVKAAAVSKAGTVKHVQGRGVWQLYRLSANSDSVNPTVLAALEA